MMKRYPTYFVIFVVLSGCGEATVIELPDKPNRALFEGIQQTMLTVGCSADGSGCHAILVGDFRVSTFPKSPAALDEEFILTKAFLDLESPSDSRLLKTALQDDPIAAGHPICFPNQESCAYRRIVSWIAYGGTSNMSPDEVCDVDEIIENACLN